MATRKKTDQPAEEEAPAEPQPVALRWLGNDGVRIGVRIFGEYRWDESNDYTQEVAEPDAIMDLLTNGDFERVEDNE